MVMKMYINKIEEKLVNICQIWVKLIKTKMKNKNYKYKYKLQVKMALKIKLQQSLDLKKHFNKMMLN